MSKYTGNEGHGMWRPTAELATGCKQMPTAATAWSSLEMAISVPDLGKESGEILATTSCKRQSPLKLKIILSWCRKSVWTQSQCTMIATDG